MASLWPAMTPDTLTVEDALLLLSFPRLIGHHPETGEEVFATYGRYGPYLKMGDDNRSLPDYDNLVEITLDEAVELFKQPKSRQRRSSQSVLAELGNHPDSGVPIQVKTGRYGPYVTDGTVNATVPKNTDPAAVTLERAVELLAAREDKLRAQGKDPRAPKKRRPRKTKKKS
jgi:DNA topoisomerase-1